MKIILLYCSLIIGGLAQSITLPEHFSATFAQTITSPAKKVIAYEGKVYFSHKEWLKWEYLTPTKKEVCSHAQTLTIVDHDLEQVSKYYIDKGIDLQAILSTAKPHHDNVYVAQYKEKQYTLALDKKGALQSIAYFDDLENKVQILFKKMVYGKGNLPSSVMQCHYPKYYDKIEG